MKKITLISAAVFAYCILQTAYCFPQGAAVNNSGTEADSSAILDVSSTSQGLLIPRMTEAQKNVISRPAAGLLIYQTDGTRPGYYFNAGDKTTKNWMYVGADDLGNHTAVQQLNMDSNKIINVATCTQNLDAANKKYVDSTLAAGGGGGCPIPDAAGTISGSSSVCKGQNQVVYSVAPVTSATGYTWSLPVGAYISSWGNTNSIAVNFSASAVSGNISVYGTNSSCNGPSSPDFAISVFSNIPSAPTTGTHIPSAAQIEWNWYPVSNAEGYKWNTTDDYASSTDNGTDTSYTQPVTCNNSYTLYVWAYNACGECQASVTLTQSSSACPPPPCTWNSSTTFNVTHTIGVNGAPETKNITYNQTQTNLTGSSQCWITQNLGADNQGSSPTDNTDAAAGWYWQFNRLQGYMTGPIPAWTINSINENSNWTSGNDPCTLLLGAGWRLPTFTEWSNADAGWSNYTDTYNSYLKLHAAGMLFQGALNFRGNYGRYWSSIQSSTTNGYYLEFYDTNSLVWNDDKAWGLSVRCLR